MKFHEFAISRAGINIEEWQSGQRFNIRQRAYTWEKTINIFLLDSLNIID